MYMAIGQCGSVLGTHIFPSTQGPRYIKGFAVSCSLMFVASVAALVLTVSIQRLSRSRIFVIYCYCNQISYRLDNARRDCMYGKIAHQHAPVDTSEFADKVRDHD